MGAIEPILVLGSYDNSKSRWIDAGAKGELSGFKFAVDLRQESRSEKVYEASGDAKGLDHVATAATLKLAFVIKDAAMPWVYYSMYDVKQGEDSDLGREDAEANADTDAFDDNGNVIGLGADILSLGNGWTPYVAMVRKSGEFVDAGDPAAKETKSKMTLHLGVLGEI